MLGEFKHFPVKIINNFKEDTNKQMNELTSGLKKKIGSIGEKVSKVNGKVNLHMNEELIKEIGVNKNKQKC